MKKKKIVCNILMAAIVVGVISGCDSKSEETNDEQVRLKWIMAGQGMQQDSQKVWNYFNEQLQEYMPGVAVDFEAVSFADYSEKWQLICAAGETADIAWTGYAFSIPDQVAKGAYMKLDDLLDQYAPDLKNEIPQWAWDLGTCNGNIYVLPIMQQYAAKSALMAPKELTDKYMNVEKIQATSKNGFFTSQENYDAVEEYLEALKADGKIGKGIYPNYLASSRHSTNDEYFWDSPVTNVFVYQKEDGTFDAVNDCDMENVKLCFKNMADWYQKGYIIQDILTDKNMDSYFGQPNGIVLTTSQVLEGEEERKTEQYGMPVKLIESGAEKQFKILSGSCKTGLAIPNTSEHPKEAIELLQLLNTPKGKDLLNILIYGIEGEHYEFIGENRIKTFDYSGSSPKSTSKYGVDKWAVGNTYYSYETTDNPEGWNEYIKEVNEEASSNVSPIMGFTFDQEPVKIELAQINAIKSQYEPVLIAGAKGADWEAYFNEYVKKLDTANQDKVRDEVIKQLNEWAKKNNK